LEKTVVKEKARGFNFTISSPNDLQLKQGGRSKTQPPSS
jgi:hypothetical protein